MNEILFSISVSISRQFPSLDPIKLRKYPLREVFWLIRNMNKTEKKSDKIKIRAKDNWF